MKIKYLNWLFAAGCAIMTVTSCTPIEDRDELTTTIAVSDIKLSYEQDAQHGNRIKIIKDCPVVTGFWDYKKNTTTSDTVTFIYPYIGPAKFTYYGTNGSEIFAKTIDVQVDVINVPLEEDEYDLVSDDTGAGKDWEFVAEPGSTTLFWAMSVPNDITKWDNIWWNAGECCAPPEAANGVMHFDFNGDSNYKLTDGGTVTTGLFKLDVAKQELSVLGGAHLLGGAERFASGGSISSPYKIVKLTETELILYLPNCQQTGTGWTFVYKAKI